MNNIFRSVEQTQGRNEIRTRKNRLGVVCNTTDKELPIICGAMIFCANSRSEYQNKRVITPTSEVV